MLEQIDSLEAREVINECDPKAISLMSRDLDWAMNITVDKLERSGGSGMG